MHFIRCIVYVNDSELLILRNNLHFENSRNVSHIQSSQLTFTARLVSSDYRCHILTHLAALSCRFSIKVCNSNIRKFQKSFSGQTKCTRTADWSICHDTLCSLVL